MNFKIGDRIFVRGYIDEIRKDTVIVRNDGGYFGTILSEVTGDLPSAQPTIFGYDLKQLILIAEILKKENISPEKVVSALTDIERIVSIVRDEFEETLRESMNQFKI